jgi:hypothetical protein
LSTYNIYSNSKRLGLKVDYKNTYKRVKRLASPEFIEPIKEKEVKEEDTGRGAIYYRISEAGMFRLFYKTKDVFHVIRFDLFHILEINGNYSIFEALLYPYFKKDTFAALHRIEFLSDFPMDNPQDVKARIVVDLCKYLTDCCSEIDSDITHNKYLKSCNKGFSPAEEINFLRYKLTIPKDDLIMKILKMFRRYKDPERLDALAILAEDNRFMNEADDFHKDFEKSFNIAMRMGKRL